jgi:hypothetical protein
MPGALASRCRLPVLLLAVLAGVAPSVTVTAAPAPAAAPWQAVTLARLTLDQAIDMAERRFHARVVRAGMDEVDGRRVYVLRMLSEQGRVWTVRVDAESGQVL